MRRCRDDAMICGRHSGDEGVLSHRDLPRDTVWSAGAFTFGKGDALWESRVYIARKGLRIEARREEK